MIAYIQRLIESIETFIVRADSRYSQGLERFISSKAGSDIADLDYWIRAYDRQLASRRSWVE